MISVSESSEGPVSKRCHDVSYFHLRLFLRTHEKKKCNILLDTITRYVDILVETQHIILGSKDRLVSIEGLLRSPRNVAMLFFDTQTKSPDSVIAAHRSGQPIFLFSCFEISPLCVMKYRRMLFCVATRSSNPCLPCL